MRFSRHQPRFSLSQVNFRLFIFGVTICLLLVYLIITNNTATKGIEISQMQVKINKMTAESRDLQVRADELKSLDRLETMSTGQLSMVNAESYIYLAEKPQMVVAVKK